MFAALDCRHPIAPMNAPPAASNPPPPSSINERDIDLMFLIALDGSAAFRAALVKKLSGMAIAEFIGAWLEVHTEEGETDLLLKVLTEGGERLAIVIQVKIDPVQPHVLSRRNSFGNYGRRRHVEFRAATGPGGRSPILSSIAERRALDSASGRAPPPMGSSARDW